jgi:hypothetical protein
MHGLLQQVGVDTDHRLGGRVVELRTFGCLRTGVVSALMSQQDHQGKKTPPSSPISWIGFFAILAMLTWAFLQG